jgi:hypothetical protein
MAKLNYYAHEIDSLLNQVNINRNNIGMNQVNVLPLPDGEIEPNGIEPGSEIVTVESDSTQGKITVTVDGTLESSFALVDYYLTVLSPDGTAGPSYCAKGRILPGIYDATDLLHQRTGDIDTGKTAVVIRVFPSSGGGSWTYDSYSCRGEFDEFSKVTIPENYQKVEVVLVLSIDGTGSVSGSAEFTPMLSLVNQNEPSFEPYKPDLQTQINALDARVTALEQQGGGYNEVQSDTVTDEIEEVTT